MKQKIFRVSFNIRVYCGGVFMYTDAHITIPAETEEEAKKFVSKNTELSIFNISNVKDVTPF